MKICNFLGDEIEIDYEGEDKKRIMNKISEKYNIPADKQYLYYNNNKWFLSLVNRAVTDEYYKDEQLTELGCPKEVQTYYINLLNNREEAKREMLPFLYEKVVSNQKTFSDAAKLNFNDDKEEWNKEIKNHVKGLSKDEKRDIYQNLEYFVKNYFENK